MRASPTWKPKYSYSDAVPFRKLLVKIKREIIRMNHPAIRPEAGRAPAVDARTVARWLAQGADDAGRPVVMLDTRNAFEVDEGTFRNAIDWRIERFTQFPDAVQAHRDELQGKTVVSFCTGGIRCEKAAIYMNEAVSITSTSSRAAFSSISRKPAGRATRASASCSTSACRWIRRWRPAGPEPPRTWRDQENPP